MYRDFLSRREGPRKQDQCNHSRNVDQCAYERNREGLEILQRIREVIFCSVPVEMKTLSEEEENGQRVRMKECAGERFVCISLEEMESYYRYSRCCQRLHSEFRRGVSVRFKVFCFMSLSSSKTGTWSCNVTDDNFELQLDFEVCFGHQKFTYCSTQV